MNTKSFRRELLIGTGGFVAGALAVSVALALWSQPMPGVRLTHGTPGINYVVVPKPAEVTFQNEFGLGTGGIGRAAKTASRASALHELNRSDIPRQQPWVAPYEFLIHPDQRH